MTVVLPFTAKWVKWVHKNIWAKHIRIKDLNLVGITVIVQDDITADELLEVN